MDGLSRPALKPMVPQQAPSEGRGGPAPDKISKTAVEFEAMFLGTVVNEMMKDTMPKTMNGGHGEEMFRSMLGNEIAREIAESGGVGIAASVEQAMRAYGATR